MSDACRPGGFFKGPCDDALPDKVFGAGCAVMAGTELDAPAGVAAWGGVLSLENEAVLVGAFCRSAADALAVRGLGAVACCCFLGSVSGCVGAALTELLAPAEGALSSTSCKLCMDLGQADRQALTVCKAWECMVCHCTL